MNVKSRLLGFLTRIGRVQAMPHYIDADLRPSSLLISLARLMTAARVVTAVKVGGRTYGLPGTRSGAGGAGG